MGFMARPSASIDLHAYILILYRVLIYRLADGFHMLLYHVHVAVFF